MKTVLPGRLAVGRHALDVEVVGSNPTPAANFYNLAPA